MDQDIIQQNLKALLQKFDDSDPEGRPITGAWHDRTSYNVPVVHLLIASGDLKQSVCTWVGYDELTLRDPTVLVAEMNYVWNDREYYDMKSSRAFIQTMIPSLGEVA